MSAIVVLTRPAGRNDSLAAALRAHAWTPVILPALVIDPMTCDTTSFPFPEGFDLIVFVSGQAARAYASQWRALLPAPLWPAAARAAAVGEATAQAICDAGLGAGAARVVVPDRSAPARDSEALWPAIARLDPPARRVLVVRGATGRDWLADRLRATGASVSIYAAYNRRAAHWNPSETAILKAWGRDAVHPTWLLTSRESIEAVASNLDRLGLLPWWRHCACVVTHEKLATYLDTGMTGGGRSPMVKTCLPTDAAMFNAIVAT